MYRLTANDGFVKESTQQIESIKQIEHVIHRIKKTQILLEEANVFIVYGVRS